ncbi:MAG: iron-containing alcohol dehydrogenase, partial [Syntrophaceae bacterium]
MQNFVFENPTRIVFGKGSIAKIGAEVKRFGGRVLMVYGMGSVRTSGVYEQVLNSLKEAGVDIVELPGVKSNPLLSKAREG